MPEESDWLEHCIPFTGVGADQTTGVIGLPPGMYVERLVKSAVVFDDDAEDGLKEIKIKDLQKEDVVANLKLWEKRIPSGIQVVDVDGNSMSREAWFNSISPVTGEPRQTDGLAIWAAKKLNWLQTGGGVQFSPRGELSEGTVTECDVCEFNKSIWQSQRGMLLIFASAILFFMWVVQTYLEALYKAQGDQTIILIYGAAVAAGYTFYFYSKTQTDKAYTEAKKVEAAKSP